MFQQVHNLGAICGYGLLPEIFVKQNYNNYNLFVITFKNFSPKGIKKFVKDIYILDKWELQKIIDYCKKNNIQKILFLGYIPHTILLNHNFTKMDFRSVNMFKKLINYTALQIFNGLVEEFKRENIEIEPLDKFLENLLADKGSINGLEITDYDLENIQFGYNIAKQIASLDIGLTVAIKNKIVVAVEALEGTDKCIQRAYKIAGKGCYITKVARPNQDMRFDPPVIGPKTIKVAKSAKISVIAIESKKTIILNKQDVIDKSRKFNIKLYGI